MDQAKAELDVEGTAVLTFGFVEEKKRYEDVIRALPSFPDLTYLIAGGFREGEGQTVLDRCTALADDLGVSDRVRHLGYVAEQDVPVVFSAADAVVLPYERVSQSGVVNEALAYRRPVVTSSLPAFEELRTEFGCLLTYDEQSELLERLSAVLTDKNTQNRLQRCTEKYIQSVSWQQFSEQSVRLYRDLAIDKPKS